MRLFTAVNLLHVTSVAGILGLGIMPTIARADQWDKKTILTINEPMQVRDTLLQPGQYVFKLLNSQSDRHIVQIFNYNQTRIIDTELAIPNYRLKPTGDSHFGFWETPSDRVKALRAWFYPGDNFGQEFPYPKQLAMANVSTATVTHAAIPETARVTEESNTIAEARPGPMPEAAAPAPAPEPAPVAAEPEPAPAPEPQQQAQDTSSARVLPKTASLYPLIGLAGLLSLSLFGLIRTRRIS